MKAYIDLVEDVLHGETIVGRNGFTHQLHGLTIRHNMQKGFPCLTIRKLEWKHALTELRFFLLGMQDKSWLERRGNHFWSKFKAIGTLDENDLGPIYGVQWRKWKNPGFPIDQFGEMITALKQNPTSRRLLVTSWNPSENLYMALPSCHDSFQFLSNGKYLDLIWRQRSVDVCVGLPWDMMLYGFMLELVAREVKLIPRQLIGQLGAVHIYAQHIPQITDIIRRSPLALPKLRIDVEEKYSLEDIIEADYLASEIYLTDYLAHPPCHFEVIP